MTESIRMESGERVCCKCPDREVGRVRAFIYPDDVGEGWVGRAYRHGPGTGCSLVPDETQRDSYGEIWAPTKDAALAWLQRVTGHEVTR